MGMNMFNVFSIVFVIMFVAVAGFIGFTFAKGVAQNKRNNNSPIITANVKVAARRTQVGSHVNGDNMMYGSAYTKYYVTFEFERADRIELQVARDRFGYIVEGDCGKLTFQGTKFIDFERT